MKQLEEMSFEEVVSAATEQALNRVMNGGSTLRSIVYEIVELGARWNRDTSKPTNKKKGNK